MRSLWVAVISALIVIWIAIPVAYTILSSFADIIEYYESLLPSKYTLRYYEEYLRLGAGGALVRSLLVGALTVALSLALGLPAGYAIGRYVFKGRDSLKLAILFFRVIPITVMAVPLAELFIRTGLYDSLLGIALAHTSLSLPFVVITTSSIFGSVPRDLEEVGYVFGLSGLQVMLRITLPLVAPGIAATALFAFLISWNEIFAATILSYSNRTLPAAVLAPYVMGTGGEVPDPYKFTATTIMVVPALILMVYIKKHLIAMWGAAGVR